jgi:hypothetical protein
MVFNRTQEKKHKQMNYNSAEAVQVTHLHYGLMLIIFPYLTFWHLSFTFKF